MIKNEWKWIEATPPVEPTGVADYVTFKFAPLIIKTAQLEDSSITSIILTGYDLLDTNNIE